MRIAHISDVHIRTLKMHDEYRRVFDNMYKKLSELKPDLIINTGDSVHSKTNISPELVEMVSDHARSVVKIAPYHIILGNHDLNLMNLDRQDALTPIIESIRDPRIHLHKKSGPVHIPELNTVLWVFSMADVQNYPTSIQWCQHEEAINIGLFHGAISNCVTDSNWRMTNTEHEASIFDGLDYVLMGDIHKRQSFNDGRIWYAGSLIQQNFGEERDKGFLVWDIEDKEKFTVTPVILDGSRKFYTVKLNEDLSIPSVEIQEGSRVRINPPRELSLIEQKDVEKKVKKNFKPFDVITLSPGNIGRQRAGVGKNSASFENLRDIGVQEKFLKDFFKDKKITPVVWDKIVDMNKRFQVTVDQRDDVTRNVSWKLNRIGWSNLFNYGEGNLFDFTSIGGITGIFAPNGAGKSSIIDVLLETLFDGTTRGINKNIFLVNDNKEMATMVADLTVNDQDYVIERTIEKIKYGAKKFSEAKEWGKTALSFSVLDAVGDPTPLTGVSRPETERAIRQRIGTYDDMLLTAVSAQWNPLDVISCKETKRREILCKFLDLDIFEQKGILGKEESKKYYNDLKTYEMDDYEGTAVKLQRSLKVLRNDINEKEGEIEVKRSFISQIGEEIIKLTSQKVVVDLTSDPYPIELKLSKAGKTQADIDHDLKNTVIREEEVTRDIEKLGKLEERFDLQAHEDAAAEWNRLGNDIQVNEKLIGIKQRATDDGKKRLKLLEEVPCGDQFPTCKFLIDAFDSKNKIPTLEEELNVLQNEFNMMAARRRELVKMKEKLDLYRTFMKEKDTFRGKQENLRLQIENIKLKKEGIEKEISDLREDLEKCSKTKEAVANNKEIDKKISNLRLEKDSADADISTFQDDLNDLNKRFGSEEGKYKLIKIQLAKYKELKDTIEAYEFYGEAMGKDGIAYRILTQKLPLINEEINKILSCAADFGVVIEDDPEEQSIRIYLQYGQYKPRLIELGSGAEKMLASVALRVALLNISNLPKTNVFIIDEGFGKLDPKNLENVGKMFDYLRSVFDHVIVISHLDVLKDMVDNTIDITTDGEGYAHVEVGV